MSIHQIAKIQLRRGKRVDFSTPSPQLSSAELGWVIDDQQLFIGNGSINEGAPNIGSTRVLTEHDLDSLLVNSDYVFRHDTASITNQIKIIRQVSDKLDETITNISLGITANEADQSEFLQLALDTLYKNTIPTPDIPIHFLPGTYQIKKPVFIPSYTLIIGSGIDRTVFEFSETGCFIFVGDDYDKTNKYDSISYNTQNHDCVLSNISINISNYGLILNCVRDGYFKNIKITSNDNNNGIVFTNYTNANYSDDDIFGNITTLSPFSSNQRNIFDNIIANDVDSLFYSECAIFNNTFNNIYTLRANHVFNMGLLYGPENNIISNSIFELINESTIVLHKGTHNISTCNRFSNVGDNMNQIYFGEVGNSSIDDIFDRIELHDQDSINYIASIGGSVEYTNTQQLSVELVANNVDPFLIQLPKYTKAHYQVYYIIDGIRRGTFDLTVDGSNVNFNDTFDVVGSDLAYYDLEFNAVVSDKILIHYSSNSLNTTLKYTYKITS